MKKVEKKDITLLISFKKKLSLYPGYAIIILFFSLLFSPTGISLAAIVLNPAEENFKDKPLIFPIPSEVQINKGIFSVDKSVFIMVPDKGNKSDDFVVKLLFNEFVDKYEQTISIVTRSSYTEKDRFILIGDITNPLVKDYCEKKGLLSSLKELGPEGYILSVSGNNVVIAANNNKGTLFGFESLRLIINN
jgi:hypothetical protein